MKGSTLARLSVLFSMFIFGTVGLFVKYIPLPSAAIAAARGIIGVIFLLAVMAVSRKKLSFSAIKQNFLWLLFSGAALGFNWILLFESYKHTTVATATLCYYLAPVFVVFASPLLLKEKLSLRRAVAAVIALLGMVPVSGVLGGKIEGARGIAFGISAAVLYASVIMLNKKLKDITAYDKTVVQLFVSAAIISPYVLITTDFSGITLTVTEVLLLVAVGIVHTGIAYALYFGALLNVSAQSAAILSYIDPVTAVVLSAVLLHEPITLPIVIGALLILGSSFLSEIKFVTKLK